VESYRYLENHFGRIIKVEEISSMLGWDQQVFMPKGSSSLRAQQLAFLKTLRHEWLTDKKLPEWLATAQEKQHDLSTAEKINLREMQRAYLHASCVPADLVKQLAEKSSLCLSVWQEAKQNSDFTKVQPYLEDVVALVRQKATVKAEALQCSVYDALHSEFNPGGSSEKIDKTFAQLLTFLPKRVQEIVEHQKKQSQPVAIEGSFSSELQHEFARKLATWLGFDFEHGRLDVSSHPFTGGISGDIRITSRYEESNLMYGLSALVHEFGHALYDGNFPEKWRGQPLGDSMLMGMTIHESQSLIWERQIGLSHAFWHFLAPKIAEHFALSSDVASADNLFKIARKVECGFIRTAADEVTYPLHVILRYEIEKALIEGRMSVKDIPEVWQQKMQDYLGVIPPNHKMGCMQDIHWFGGSFGYFPCYAMGAMTAVQFFNTAQQDLPNMMAHIERGEFEAFSAWLKTNIHQHGCLYQPDELVKKVTQETLNVSLFDTYLKNEYLNG